MFSKALLNILVLALAVLGSPVAVRDSHISLPISRRLNTTGVYNVYEHDLARARHFKSATAHKNIKSRGVFNEAVTNTAVVYAADIGVGTPPTFYSLIVDTGSSNTWVGAGKAYVKTGSSVRTSDSVSVSYGSGSFSGTEYLDTVTLTSSLVLSSQSIGVASTSTGFNGYDGILGIGPVDLTVGTLSPDTGSSIPTVTDMAYSQGFLSADEVGVSFQPTTTDPNTNGELTWGGTDNTKYTSAIGYAPITFTSPASAYWGVDQFINYGSTTILGTTAGIVDTGTTLVLIATDAFSSYVSLTGATSDAATGLYKVTSTQYSSLQSLFFGINGGSYELTANGQIWPRALNSVIGGTSGAIYLIVADIGSFSGSGLDFINGFSFLERFYTVYDTANSRVGFAYTSSTYATSN
ncbi:hypothetical protein AX17_006502 [Amanita inopinata Kibby_2008]|nr:hypothetical protein AX17_006502 [Amanita inopinata Kibby_2008]